MGLLILTIGFFIFIIVGTPIAFAMGGASLVYALMVNPGIILAFPQRLFAGSDRFILIALPLFILAGEIMNRGGVTQRIIDFSMYIVRPIKGGLGEVNVVSSMIFGGISGSSVADTSAIGSMLIPQMVKKGYDLPFATGVTVASSTMGQIIPPSIPMLIFAMIANVSVGALFLAGILPGLLIGCTQIGMVYYISKKRGYHPIQTKFVLKDFVTTARDGLLSVLMPVMIVLTVSFGVATPSESAGVAVLYALILGILVYKELNLKEIGAILKKTLITSSSLMIIVSFASVFAWLLTIEQAPSLLANFMLDLSIHKNWILLMLVAFILLIGTFIDGGPALLLFVPILIPIMDGLGVDRLHFGAIMVVGLAVSLVTPPVGMCLNAACKISGLSITKIFRGALPLLICNAIVLLLVTFIPGLSLWIPSFFF